MKRHYQSFPSLIIIDMISIVVSYLVAYLIRFHTLDGVWEEQLYRMGFICLLLVYLCIAVCSDCLLNFIKRGYFKEFVIIIQVNVILGMAFAFVLYFLYIASSYSRIFFIAICICNIALMYSLHIIYKQILKKYYSNKANTRKLLVVATTNVFPDVLHKLKGTMPDHYDIVGLVLLDQSGDVEAIEGISNVANRDTMYEYIRKSAVDEVFISVMQYPTKEIEDMILTLQHMGIVVDVNVRTFGLKPAEKALRSFGKYHVLTYSTNVFDGFSMMEKRLMDIVGSAIGLLITVIVSIIVVPAIYMESPGPVIFTQTRVGTNGRRFKIYKFRSMYMDAEERKKELMSKNEMNGLMFKMKDDPRITKVGKFIRKTSIDELPQFWNVLKGDMSLVGTRPPTVDEFLMYTNVQKRRLSLRPGITGLWQVSGRSEITDFEEVVRLDLEYIDNWSVGQDIRLILKTIGVVFFGRGAN